MSGRYLSFSVFFLSFLLITSVKTFAYNQNTSEKILNIYNWEDYFADSTIEDFEKTSGITVNLTTFQEEEEMISHLMADPSAFDIVIMSASVLREMRQMRLLSDIEADKIPNINNLSSRFRSPAYDPEHQYSVPYLWGTTGIVINKKYIKEKNPGWDVLWNPEYKGRIALLDSPEEVCALGMTRAGYPIHSAAPEERKKAEELLLEQKPLVAGYWDTITIMEKMMTEEIWAAQIYSGDGMQVAEANPDAVYILPKEGFTIWTDNFTIPRDALHKDNARLFINYVLEPGSGAEIVNDLRFAGCNQAAEQLIDKDILMNKGIYPPADVLASGRSLKDFSSEEQEEIVHEMVNRTWERLRSAE